MKPASGEKIQKVLARTGIGSRRRIEEWVQAGRIKVNQKMATIGMRVQLTDKISLDGRLVNLTASTVIQQVLCYHKPVGEVCTRDDTKGRPTVFEHLPRPANKGRWINIGRLDLTTSGLLLFTTDGELAHRLMHPAYTIEREYAVRVLGEVDAAMLDRLRRGIRLAEGITAFKSIVDAGGQGANHWYHVTLKEGRYHEVRRLWESQGVTVSRLIRIRFGPVSLPKHLRAGHAVKLDEQMTQALLQQVGLIEKKPATAPRRAR
jgi:23S rRNA pseudouridine2605 synthase